MDFLECTFNLIIRLDELKGPGKEIIKATNWGPRHNSLLRLVAFRVPQGGGTKFGCSKSPLTLAEAIPVICFIAICESNGPLLRVRFGESLVFRLYTEIDHIHLSSEAQCVSHLLPPGGLPYPN